MGRDKDAKKEQAQELYVFTDMAQNEIAEQLGITTKTISVWKREGKWEEIKAARTVTKNQIIQNTYLQIASIYKKAKEEDRNVTVAETDQLIKLGKLIEAIDKKLSLSVIIQVFKELTGFIMNIDVDFAKELNKYQQEFINSRVNEDM